MRRAGRSPTRVAPTDDAGRCHPVLASGLSPSHPLSPASPRVTDQPPGAGDDPSRLPMVRCARHRPGQVMCNVDSQNIPRTSALMSTVDTRPPTIHPARTLRRLADAGASLATVVEAPAGWGKTTLMAAWAETARRFGR